MDKLQVTQVRCGGARHLAHPGPQCSFLDDSEKSFIMFPATKSSLFFFFFKKSVQFSLSVVSDPMDCSTPGFTVHTGVKKMLISVNSASETTDTHTHTP